MNKLLLEGKDWLAASSRQSTVIRTLNWLQTSKWVVFGSSLLGLILAYLLFPLWLQVFTYPNRTVEIQMSAPKGEVVRAYWDNPEQHPEAYTPITVNPPASKHWQVNIESLGEKNPQSTGIQVTVLDISTPEEPLNWSKVGMPAGGWSIAPHNDPSIAAQGISATSYYVPQVKPLLLTTTGSQLKIRLLRRPDAGKVKVKVNDEVRIVDLYDPEIGVEELNFPVLPGQPRLKNYEIKIVDTVWHKLQFLPESQGRVRVKQVRVNNQRVRAQANQASNVFVLPKRFWHRSSSAVLATSISWLIMMLLFISTVHLWQGLGVRRLGTTFYIVILPMILGGFWMLVFYPAYMTLDSINQWYQALQNHYHNWYPPIMAVMMHWTLPLSNSPNVFTFIQGVIFWFAILFLLRQVLISNRFFLISATLLILLPSLWIYGATLVNNTLTAAFALIAAGLLIYAMKQQNWKSFWLSLVFLSLAICFRREAIFITCVPILVSQLMLGKRKKLIHRLVHISLILLIAYIPSKLLPQLVSSNPNGPVSYVFINQYVGTIVHANLTPVEEEAEKQAVDQQFGVGMFDFFMKNYECGVGERIWLSETGGPTFANTPENTKFVLRKVLETAIHYPGSFIQHRLCNLSYTLQVPMISYYWGIVGNPTTHDIQLKNAGIEPSSRLPEFRKWVLSTIENFISNPFTRIIFLHWLFLIILGLNFIFGIFSRNVALWISSLFGLAYFAGFLIPDGFTSWRYLLLCYLCSLISTTALIEQLIHLIKHGMMFSKRS